MPDTDLPEITERDVRLAMDTAQAYLASRAGDPPGTQSGFSPWALNVLVAAAGQLLDLQNRLGALLLAGQAPGCGALPPATPGCQECSTRWFNQVRRTASQARAQERSRAAAIAEDLDLTRPPATYQPDHPALGEDEIERAQIWHARRIATIIRATMAEDDVALTHTADLLPVANQEPDHA